jgi:hypothetical protein
MDLGIVADPRLYEFLLLVDRDLAEAVRVGGCPCGGALHRADYPRKPRGALVEPGPAYGQRLSWCCAVCRRRRTPPSVRFLGRRVYLGAVVVLATALSQGLTARRAAWIRERIGACPRTLARWQAWWRERFVASAFWKTARASIQPPLSVERLPATLLERFSGADARERLIRALRFLSPMTTTSA